MKPLIHLFRAALVLSLLPLSLNAQFIENSGQVMDAASNFHPEVKFTYGQGTDHLYFQQDRVVCAFSRPDNFDFRPYQGNQAAIDSITATLGKQTQRIDMEFLGASKETEIIAGEQNPGTINYFLNQRENITGVRNFKSITYKNLYPFIDIIFYQLP
jgi:hypothetical protein